MAHSPDSKWLTVADVAEILGTSTETIRRMIKAGELTASRASNAARAAWLIDAVAFERQREADAERAAIRQRLGGVVSGRGEGFLENLEASDHPPEVKQAVRETHSRVELFDYLEREMREDPVVRQRLETLDEDERIEVAAQELARRVRAHERIQRRAMEILDEDKG